MTRLLATMITAAGAASLLLAGCGGAANAGGDTQCRDFLAMSAANQGAVVARMLKERNGRNSSTSDVERQRSAIAQACGPEDKQRNRIEDVAG